MREQPGRGIHVFTTRMPKDEFEAWRARAARAGCSVNEMFLRALRAYAGDEVDLTLEVRVRTNQPRLSDG